MMDSQTLDFGLDLEIATINHSNHADPACRALVAAFHAGIYLDAFAAQREPLAIWQRALADPAPRYDLTIRIAGRALRDPARRELLGGIAYERYLHSGCGLVTYMVIAPAIRRRGVGKRLQAEAVRALHGAGAPVVFGEVNDPRRRGPDAAEPATDMWRRVRRNQAWGARALDLRYVQPALAPGLARDPGLCLLALAGDAPLPATLDGAIVRAFITELYAIAEGNTPDRELLAGIPDRVALIELA